MITLIIPGKPIAKARPRFARRGKFVNTYSTQETEEGKFLLLALSQYGKAEPLRGALSVSMYFGMPIPKSTSNTRSGLMLEGKIHHTKKPDIDNLVKFTLDALSGTVFSDDRQIVAVRASKGYDDRPRTEIVIVNK